MLTMGLRYHILAMIIASLLAGYYLRYLQPILQEQRRISKLHKESKYVESVKPAVVVEKEFRPARQVWGPGVVAMGFGYPRQISLPAEYVLGLQVEDEPEPLYFVYKPLYDSVEIGDVIQVAISHWYDKRGIPFLSCFGVWKTRILCLVKKKGTFENPSFYLQIYFSFYK